MNINSTFEVMLYLFFFSKVCELTHFITFIQTYFNYTNLNYDIINSVHTIDITSIKKY